MGVAGTIIPMLIAYNITLALGLITAILFTLLVLVTGKGDAMSGGGSIRTTFKGKASFDDQMSRATLFLGVGFMVLMVLIDVLSQHALKK